MEKIKDMLDLQLGLAYTKAMALIKSLEERESLYIINKNMEARVLFYYKENTYFISDVIPLNIDYIQFSDSIEIEDICRNISDNFENVRLIAESLLAKDKKSIVLNYMINSLIITVNRMTRDIIDISSLEIYNDLTVISLNGVFKLFKQNERLYCDEFDITLTNNKKRILAEDLLKNAYEEYDIFPHDFKYKVYDTFNIKDIIPTNDITPIITISMVSSEELVSIGYIPLDRNIKYKEKDISTLIDDILTITNESEDIEEDTELALSDLYYKYNLTDRLLN